MAEPLIHSTPPAEELSRGLVCAPPFGQMTPAHVAWFMAVAEPVEFAAGEQVLAPDSGPVDALLCICKGSITGRLGMAAMAGQFEYEVGDLFPVGAALANRPVTATYSANEATTCLRLPAARMQELAAMSAPFADFLNRRVVQYLELARKAVHASWAAQPLAEQTLEARLGSLPAREPLTCATTTPLQDALTRMQERQVGSIIVLDAAGAPHGILTRHDILGRVTLPQRPLSTAIAEVMSAPLQGLTVDHTLQDAALAMSRHGIRHLAVTDHGRLVNVVSERDLFALQRQSLNQLSKQIRVAPDLATLQHLAGQIRQFARNLLGQGVQAWQLTELISHLNDLSKLS